ncbi:MAG: M81 family metallopeptidase [Anaerolineaceae bacterium]|nr:M81 family metallopeptidase [Anaerolineaceae bacterium]
MARFAVAGFLHETNTFAPGLTPFEAFTESVGDETGMRQGDEILEFQRRAMAVSSSGFIRRAAALGHQIVPLIWAQTEPSGIVTDDAFDRITKMILDDLRAKGPFDGVYLDLHGAMVTQSYEDAETEIGRRVRSVIADIPLVASLDLHGNITQECLDVYTALVGYRTYPHVDIYETGERAADLLAYLLHNPPLHKAFRKPGLILPASLMSTLTEPCLSIYPVLEQLEKEKKVVSATFMHGFPCSDIYEVGPAIFAYAATPSAAEEAVLQIEKALLEHENELTVQMLDPDQAVLQSIQLSAHANKPVILADVQDNPGAGSSSDTVWILDALVRHEAQDAALGLFFDPESAAAAHAAGQGAQITIDLGGKLLPGQKPYHGTFSVEKITEGEFKLTGPYSLGLTANLGKMAQLKIGGVRIVVVSGRTQANDQAYFRRVGIEPKDMQILALKSTNHYRADFQPISSHILIVDAPGGVIEDPAKTPYKHIRPGVRLGKTKIS